MFTAKRIREGNYYMPDIGKSFIREPFPISGIFYVGEIVKTIGIFLKRKNKIKRIKHH